MREPITVGDRYGTDIISYLIECRDIHNENQRVVKRILIAFFVGVAVGSIVTGIILL